MRQQLAHLRQICRAANESAIAIVNLIGYGDLPCADIGCAAQGIGLEEKMV
jgi:hypothetical protein